MPVTPFKAISFVKDETITKNTMDQLQSNFQWIYDNTPRGGYFRTNGNSRDERTVLMAGRHKVMRDPKTNAGTASVSFGRGFHPDCKPHVTTGIITDKERRVWCVVNGPGGTGLPNSSGFEIKIRVMEPPVKKQAEADKTKKDERVQIEKEFWVAWHAFGYRPEKVNEV